MLAAVVGWAGLALQLALIVQNLGATLGLWRFVGFFTILTNLGAAAVATAIAVGRTSGLGSPRARLMAATSILTVGIVYSVALRSLWNPTGLQKIADVALHDLAPLAWLALWLSAAHPRYRWRGDRLGVAAAAALLRLCAGARSGRRLVRLLVPQPGGAEPVRARDHHCR